MECLLIVARNDELCEYCNDNKRGMTLKNNYNELLDYTIQIGRTNFNAIPMIEFEPFIYSANYKHSFESNDHPIHVTMRWIYHGYPNKMSWNRFELTIESARIIHNIYKKDLYIIGNSVSTPDILKTNDIPADALVMRFNKAILYEKRIDICVFNDVIYESLHEIIMRTQIECIDVGRLNIGDRFNFMRSGNELLTTGIIMILWLLKFFTLYQSINVIGFNMVNPGEYAHYFDSESPSNETISFAGHNAANETKILEDVAEKSIFKLRWLKV